MNLKPLKKVFLFFAIFITVAIIPSLVYAAPYDGQVFQLRQPDGSNVEVKVYGDEFYQRVESTDGYTLVRDSKTQWICYAKLNEDSSDFISTGITYNSADKNKNLSMANYNKSTNLSKHLKLDNEQVKKKVKLRKKDLVWDNVINSSDANSPAQDSNGSINPISPAPVYTVNGDIKGLTILIDFPDEKSSISKNDIESMFNATNYTGYGNSCSLRDYYYAVSDGKVNYTNTITEFYTAKHEKAYYDNANNTYGLKARELITEAVLDLQNKGFDFSALSKDEYGNVRALNVFYAGNPTYGWSNGLWPHSGGIYSTIGNVSFTKYQITNIGNTLSVGTTAHENGHMVFHWPDTYDYGHQSVGAGDYDLMSSGANYKDPRRPNPYFRCILSGWGSIQSLNNYADSSTVSVAANTIGCYMYKTTKQNEYFLVENLERKGLWNNALADEGLIIWHIDEYGSNENEEMTPQYHYMVSVEQADGTFALEHGSNSGGDDLFHAGYNSNFLDTSLPNSKWWDGQDSGLSIKDIGELGDVMNFTIQKVQPLEFTQEVENTTSSQAKLLFKPSSGVPSSVTVHYNLNDGGEAVYPMVNNNGTWEYSINGLTGGININYYYTYEYNEEINNSITYNYSFPNENNDFAQGVMKVSGTQAKVWFKPKYGTPLYIIIHYTLNNGLQLNCQMTNNNGTWEYVIDGLANGETINYNFTYEKSGTQYDSLWYSHMFSAEAGDNLEFTQGAEKVTSTQAKLWFKPSNGTPSLVTVHYYLNNAEEVTNEMANNNGTWELSIDGLTGGTNINYYFTYEYNTNTNNSTTYSYSFPNETSDFSQGVTKVSSTQAKVWFIPNYGTPKYVIIHYKLNNGLQLNYQLNNNNGTWEYNVNELNAGTVIDYAFTYDKNGTQFSSEWNKFNF